MVVVAVSSSPPKAEAIDPRLNGRTSSIRWLGALLLILVFTESVLGILAAGTGRTIASGILVAHVGLGIGVVGVAGWALVVAFRFPGKWAFVATGLTFSSVSLTAAVGAVFLLLGDSQAAIVDRTVALVALGEPH